MVKDPWRLHRRAFRPSRVARGDPVRTRAPTSVALRARTNLEVRNPAQTKTTLRRENDPGYPFPRRLNSTADYADQTDSFWPKHLSCRLVLIRGTRRFSGTSPERFRTGQ